jgi:hypothetical protein
MNKRRTAIYFLLGPDRTVGVHCGAEFSPGERIIVRPGESITMQLVKAAAVALVFAGGILARRQLGPMSRIGSCRRDPRLSRAST